MTKAAEQDGLEMRCFTFDTTHHALWAEEVAGEHRIPSELIPAPAAANARCNLALTTLAPDFGRLAEIMRAEGIPFAIYRSGG